MKNLLACLVIAVLMTGCSFTVVDTRTPEERASAEALRAEAVEIVETEAEQVSCDLKGNIDGKGEKILHLPGGAYYGRVKIDLTRGEKWFCTTEEAVAEGWRLSAR